MMTHCEKFLSNDQNIDSECNSVSNDFKSLANHSNTYEIPQEKKYSIKLFDFNYKNCNDSLSSLNYKISNSTDDFNGELIEYENCAKLVDKNVQNIVQLNNAFKDCINVDNLNLSSDNNNCLVNSNKVNEKKKSLEMCSENRKRKLSESKKLSCSSSSSSCSSNYDTESDNSCKKKKIPKSKIMNKFNFQRQKPKSCKEVAVGIPDIFTDQSQEVEKWRNTLERFLQKGLCLGLPPKIDKCIECRSYQSKKNLTKRDYDNITCRFYAFRQLRFTKTGRLSVAGYPDPYKDMNNADLKMWLPDSNNVPDNFDVQVALKVLEDTGGQFCRFVQDENEALYLNWPNRRKKRKVAWKKCVNGIREMCDVCKTTIFNHHWVCGKCGFVVCVDCYKSRLLKSPSISPNSKKNYKRKRDKEKWLYCSDQVEHQVDHLTITQILAGDALNLMSKYMHDICYKNKILLDCNCSLQSNKNLPSINLNPITDMFMNNINSSSDEEDEIDTPALKKLLSKQCFDFFLKSKEDEEKVNCLFNLTNPITDQIETSINTKEMYAPKLSLLIERTTSVPHTWLCDGRLLRLLDPKNVDNCYLFQDQWKRGQPVIVSDVGKNLNSSLWHPESFSRDFGDQKNDLINCASGKLVPNQPMSKFWNGFENASERLCDNRGNSMLLKLKDWPPSADFAETLPDRFQDLMNSLPLKEYTHRDGKFNLASRLPEGFVRPDLGPKMYTAYGNAGTKYKLLGTTNLHLDISDAVNVMVYVAITKNCKEFDYNWHVKEALQVIEEAGCDILTKKRVYEQGEIPGALWHIYHASDADCIRDFLNKVSIEQGIFPEQHHDPIHDQSHYLDAYLRERLFKEYGVKGYPIVQCYGDAVFIPAGAPHQVRNLHNCIKVAEDFVSPENVHHSFRMTQEFRDLTDSHTNHEDKLQIKNIVFHAIKDSLSVLMNQCKLI
ncbi:lysine-specific demethylase 3A [Daktulosphaira vitifoliae]|uniref:lysine-specific demethylase 3A n=1 Tax=Daktulosphaira vitifoliae TaxID=58002 RepID=UPI0021AAEFD6|nr:lysine-specific demethylase 3A [Daktulosphaira vitifoliae]